MAVAWEAVKARLVAALPGVVGSSVRVFDGPVVDGSAPSSYLTVGWQPSTDDLGVGSFEQGVGPDGYRVTETGTVLCELGAVTGDTTVPSVFASFSAITAHLASDQTLGGTLLPGSTVTAEATVVQGQTQSGAVQRLLIGINYFTNII